MFDKASKPGPGRHTLEFGWKTINFTLNGSRHYKKALSIVELDGV